jgi:hypothetical protein
MFRNKSFYTLFFLIGLLIINSGCEGNTCANGIICDLVTKEPLDSVACSVKNGSTIKYSDKYGEYEVCNKFGGCVPKCKEIVVEFTKKGFKTKKLTNPNSDTIYLEKL